MAKGKLVAAAAFSAALLGGGAAGALLGTPTLTAAQEEDGSTTTTAPDDTTTTTPDSTDDGEARDHERHAKCGPAVPRPSLSAAAEALGISVDELREELRAGSSIADVAEERGVDLQAVIDAMVAAATEEIDERVAAGRLDAERAEELKAELPERIASLVQRDRDWVRIPNRWVRFHDGFAAAAEALGITKDELRDELRAGSSIADVAEERGVDVQAVIDAMVAEATEEIDERVAAGRLDAERAEELKANLADRIAELVEGD
ncbi:MAG TPA: hypothetical protein VF183_00435 [Acidimicrobiales bacterium]